MLSVLTTKMAICRFQPALASININRFIEQQEYRQPSAVIARLIHVRRSSCRIDTALAVSTCVMLGSHSGVDEDSSLLGCYTVSTIK
jgi:hypothetical protein